MIERRWTRGIGLLVALLAAACGGPAGTDGDPATGRVVIALSGAARAGRVAPAVGPGLPADVERIAITCTGPGMDPVTGDLPLDGSPLVLTVPAGPDRRFAADAWAGDVHRMAGSSVLASLAVNETATVSITLEELGTITFATPPPAAVTTGRTVAFDVDMTGFENPAVVWTVNGIPGGDEAVGTVTEDGVYTAPAVVPDPAEVTVRAASALAPDLYAEAVVVIQEAVVCGDLAVDAAVDTADAAPGDGVCADADGACTLRAAVQEANACPGGQTITVPAGTYTLTLAGANEDAAATGDLDVTDDLIVTGAGADVTAIDGNAADRVFHAHGVALTLERVTVRNGLVQGVTCMEACGGGILASGGTLTVVDTTVADNRAEGDASGNAGGIYASGAELIVTNATIRDNIASSPSWSVGGGILKTSLSDATITNTTISGNAAGMYGGGMQINRGTVTFVNSTVTANRAGIAGAGLYVKDIGYSAAFHLFNTIVADQASGGDCGTDGAGAFTAGAANLDSDGSCDGATTADPLLDGLADNGGPTWTHALQPGSPAIDAGDNAACPAADQRGEPRDDGACDLGAYEFGGTGGAVAVTVSPPAAAVPAGAEAAFAAVVTGAGPAVTWTVEGSTCSDPGTITAWGDYTAGRPVEDCTETVRATSTADPLASATAVVTVDAPVAVAVSPASVSLAPGGSEEFGVTVTGDADRSVTWTVAASTCSDPGTVDAAGVYTAGRPVEDCTETVRATSTADPGASATAVVTVDAPVAVTVSGPSSVLVGDTAAFSAAVTGAADTGVTWYVNDVAGGDATVGTIGADGVYTAPAAAPSPDTVTVRAVSAADGVTAGTLAVRVVVPTCLGGYLAVDSTADAADASPGDGLCDDGAGNCTLRAAVEEANACPGMDAIDVPAGTYALTLGTLVLTDEITVRGAGQSSTRVDGGSNGGRRILTVGSDLASVTLEDLTLENASVTGGGGAIWMGSRSPTVLRRVTLRGNAAASGGAVSTSGDSTLTVEDATITGNRSENSPGGSAFKLTDGDTLTIRSSTMTGNRLASPTGSGAGLILDWSYGSPLSVTIENSTLAGNDGTAVRANSALTVEIVNSTITNNTLGLYAGEAHAPSRITVTNSILYGNGTNCATNGGIIASGGHNIDSRDTCGFAAAGDQVNTDPMLGALVDNGGPTRTRGPLAGSPALDAGDNTACPAADQRGAVRGDGACDIGAVEGVVPFELCLGASVAVDSTADAVDFAVGDGVCDDGAGNCTLRAAVQEANACVGPDGIDLPAGTYALTLGGTGEDAAATGDLDITDDLTLDGAGAATTVIDGSDGAFGDRLFHVLNNVTTAFSNLTLQGVSNTNIPGGGVATNGDLQVTDVVITGNSAKDGTGLYAAGSGTTVTVTRATLSGNTGNGSGAAIYVGANVTLEVSDSTLSDNTQPYEYGHRGVAVYGGTGATIHLTRTLVDNNASGYGEAVYGHDGATINLTDSTVSNSQAGTRGVVGWTGSTVNIVRSTLSGNLAGGLSTREATSTLNITDATVRDNEAHGLGSFAGNGAGAEIEGAFTITGATFTGNRIVNDGLGGTGWGAGVYLAATADGTIVNATFSGNHNGGQYGWGGAIGGAGGSLILQNATLSGNTAPNGGNFGVQNGTLVVSNTIFNDGDCNMDDMAVSSAGHNIDSGNTCGLTDPTDQVDTDPLLDLLADNGGPTWTHALQPGSPAIDRGDDAQCPATDQRGAVRPEDGDGDGTATCDVGAFEYAP